MRMVGCDPLGKDTWVRTCNPEVPWEDTGAVGSWAGIVISPEF